MSKGEIVLFGYNYYQLCWCFVIYSFCGWVIEVIYYAIKCGKVVNRGFLAGPTCPVYGFGTIAVLCVSNRISENTPGDINVFLLFLIGAALSTAVEFIAGWGLDHFFHARWWDYSKMPYNIKGYICPTFSLIWGLAVVFVIKVAHPLIKGAALVMLPEKYGYPLLFVVFAIYALDTIITVINVNGLNKDLAKLKKVRKDMEKISGGMSDVIGGSAIKTARLIEDEEVQADLWKKETEAQRNSIINKVWKHRNSGEGRIIRAFPDMQHHKYYDELRELKNVGDKNAGHLSKS